MAGESRYTREKPVLLPLCPPQIRHGLDWIVVHNERPAANLRSQARPILYRNETGI
jgi:hypothetical protein